MSRDEEVDFEPDQPEEEDDEVTDEAMLGANEVVNQGFMINLQKIVMNNPLLVLDQEKNCQQGSSRIS